MNLHTPEPLEARIAPATFTVSTTADSGAGSFRQAILDANASLDASDSILFSFTDYTTISPLTALPSLASGIFLDGFIAAPNYDLPHVILDGSLAGAGVSGLTIAGTASRVQYLAIVNFSAHGIVINGSGNFLQANYIGTDATLAAGLGNGGDGVRIESGSGNWVGPPLGALSGRPNVIVDNGGAGVHLALGSTATTVSTNSIGITFTNVTLPNLNGIVIDGDSSANIVEGNVISSNTDYGIKVNSTAVGNTSAPSQFIRGNFIGTGNGGLGDFGNGKSGVFILSSHGVRVGGTGVLSGTGASEGNIISGNGTYGVEINSGDRHQLYGNWIGIDSTGSAIVANNLSGVYVNGSTLNLIGSTGGHNVISGNGLHGVNLLAGGASNSIIGNYIGTNSTGSAALGNTGDGIRIQSVLSTTIGGGGTNAGNVISGNGGDGVFVSGGTSATGTTMKQNFIGTTAAGTGDLGNGGNGIQFASVLGTASIGGSGVGNVIAGNGLSGILVGTADLLTIQGNTIGLSGSANARGILINAGSGTTVGAFSAGQGNNIGFNTGAGVAVAGTANTTIRGNSIHDNGGIGIDLGNNGPTANDGDDSDSGANGLLNFPVINSVVVTGANMLVSGTYTGLANTALTVDFYSNSAIGQAETYLGSANVLTDNNGLANFAQSLATIPAGRTVSATTNITATPSQTSEISAKLTPLPGLTISDFTAAEGASGTTNFTFTLTLGAASATAVTVDFTTADNSANAGSDYIAASGTVTFAPGQTSRTVTISVSGDSTTESNETFFVNLSNAVGAVLTDAQAIGTITNDDNQFLTIADASIAEGNSGTTNLVFTVSLNSASASSITVEFAAANGTATAGSDFVATTGTLTFAAGELTKTITVPLLGDTAIELTETLLLNLSNATGATISDSQAVGTITNDDFPALTIGDVTLVEGDAGTTDAVFTVSVSASAPFPITVDFSTANGTATAGSDFVATTGTLTFAAGELTKTITVPLLGDTAIELTETLLLNLSNATGATISDSQAVGTITNDDFPTLTIADVTLVEGNAGTTNAVFTVSVSAAAPFPITVDFSTANGTATAGSDFVATTGTLTFAAGELTKTITVPLLGDTTIEQIETLLLNLSNAIGATISDSQAVGTITNDDFPSLSIGDVSALEASGSFTFTVTMSEPVAFPVSVNYSTLDGTALTDVDFTTASGTINFATGETSAMIVVQIADENRVENDETFSIQLTSPTNASIADGSAVGTILNDDTTTLNVTGVSISEGNSGTRTANFTVSLSAPSDLFTSFSYATRDGTATAGSDYIANSGSRSIFPGQTTFQISATVNGDTRLADDETFFLDLTNIVGALPGVVSATGTILNDETAATLTVSDFSAAEGDSGTTAFQFAVQLSRALEGDITIPFSTASDTAVEGDDFTAATGSVTIAAGATSANIVVSVIGETLVEQTENFSVNLGVISNAPSVLTVTRGTAVGTIQTDDVSVTISNSTFTEGASPYRFTISLSSVSVNPVTVNFTIRSGTATSISDFTDTAGFITFIPSHPNVQTITLNLVNDSIHEFTESFFVDITSTTAQVLVPTAEVTILDDDAPTVSLISGNPVLNVEDGADDAGRIPFVVFLSEASAVPITVRIKTAQGTATADDFSKLDRIITFAPGSTVFESEVVITADLFAERDETFTLSLSESTNAVLDSDVTLDFTIRDNDGLKISANKKTATWRDLDGDLVTLKVTKPVLTPAMFTFRYGTPIGSAPKIAGQLLESFDLTSAFFTAEKTGISIKAKRKGGLGDGQVNVGAINATGMNLSAVSVSGDLGRINAGHQVTGTGIKSLTLRSLGDFGTTTQSAGGNLVSTIKGNLGKLKVASNFTDATLRIAGSLVTDGNLGSVTIGGSLRGGDGDGIFASGRIGKIAIRHDIIGIAPLDAVSITAVGKRLPTATTMVAIASLSVGGQVANAEILAGYSIDGAALNPHASIGAVKVKQTWAAATLAAGIIPGTDGLFGTADDRRISGADATLVSRIASITIGGEVTGTASAGDHFGFIAGVIGSAKIAGVKQPLTATPNVIPLGTTGDVTMRDLFPPTPLNPPVFNDPIL